MTSEHTAFWAAVEVVLEESGGGGASGVLIEAFKARNQENARNALADLLLDDKAHHRIIELFKPVLVDFLARLVDRSQQQGSHSQSAVMVAKYLGVFASIVPDAPYLDGLVEEYLQGLPSGPLEPFIQAESSTDSSDHPLLLVRVISSLHTLLCCCSPSRLANACNWSSLWRLCFHEDATIRWHAASTSAALLRLNGAARSALFQRLQLGSLVPQVLAEQAVSRAAPSSMGSDPAFPDMLQGWSPLPDRLANVEGTLLPRRRPLPTGPLSALQPLVPTPTTQAGLSSLTLALLSGGPILVHGPPGSGKSALIRELARLTGNFDLVEIHLDDQVDAKALLGAYVSADTPGEFRWQPGPLSLAVERGLWVLIEDLDRAPLEVVAALAPLLETGELAIPGRRDVLRAAPGFQVVGTVSRPAGVRAIGALSVGPMGTLMSRWTRVPLEGLPEQEVEQVLQGKFPSLPSAVVQKLIETFARLADGEATGGSHGSSLRRASTLRDLMKLCNRVEAARVMEHTSASGYVTDAQKTEVVAHALDLLACGLSDEREWVSLAKEVLAPVWGLRPEGVVQLCLRHAPEVVNGENGVIRMGRAALAAGGGAGGGGGGGGMWSDRFVPTGHALRAMERVGVAVQMAEPVLLVGETGGGKTSLIQQLAGLVGQRLLVQNLSLQTDSADLVGGYRPVDVAQLGREAYAEFLEAFTGLFSRKKNARFLHALAEAARTSRWAKLSDGFHNAIRMAKDKLSAAAGQAEGSATASSRWANFEKTAERFKRHATRSGGGDGGGFAFAFSEGLVVRALREGHWILLDEINLATPETLQRLTSLLEGPHGSLCVTERGDVAPVPRHPSFRLFAAMNPATDAGKKSLPPALRARFTELYISETRDPQDLRLIVTRSLGENVGGVDPGVLVSLYLRCLELAEGVLVDGAGQRPRYSLRTLCRALRAAQALMSMGFNARRALLEAFCLSFETMLKEESRPVLHAELRNSLAPNMTPRELEHPTRRPGGAADWVLVDPFWLSAGPEKVDDWAVKKEDGLRRFVPTPSALANLRSLARALAGGEGAPVLLQGPTSGGKTTLVEYLAARTGHRCLRINNHEHTDVSEYAGAYATDPNSGRLVFADGLLVKALREGHWIILDELNLAPPEVLEGLNRLLDDNRELLVPETQEVIKPHPAFRLFATQNPPGAYGGRKPLSRAFRNRFFEVHMGSIPTAEMEAILNERAALPPSFCKALVKVMQTLQTRRHRGGIFEGKDSLVTPRDLLRWAHRQPTDRQALASEGYMLLCERLRRDEEKDEVRRVIEKECGAAVAVEALYDESCPEMAGLREAGMAPTPSMRRLIKLVSRGLQHKEAMLLVGGTGAGKTTVCQVLAGRMGLPLHAVNCHAHMETADLLGALRPLRGREKLQEEQQERMREFERLATECGYSDMSVEQVLARVKKDVLLLADKRQQEVSPTRKRKRVESGQDQDSEDVGTGNGDDGDAASCTEEEEQAMAVDISEEQAAELERLGTEILQGQARLSSLFEWQDGQLVTAMQEGGVLLLDEISLADDAVLERLNSVLEPKRSLVVAERGGEAAAEVLIGHESFRLVATMNPGGDFGKRELSPALRSRFTEIWVPALESREDLEPVLLAALLRRDGAVQAEDGRTGQLEPLAGVMLDFAAWLRKKTQGRLTISLRDLVVWASFVADMSCRDRGPRYMAPTTALLHGAELALLDGLGMGSVVGDMHTVRQLRDEARRKLRALLSATQPQAADSLISISSGGASVELSRMGGEFGMEPFMIACGDAPITDPGFLLTAPTPAANLLRLLRALQMGGRAVLLEGSPGVGKSSLVEALAKASGHGLTRINLSEQTDLSDLLGSDLPCPGGDDDEEGGDVTPHFMWQDGALLRAIRDGQWVLLDELNLAPQAVLEGLNSLLDHRAEVFLPELALRITCPTTFRVFATQNPLAEGGGRKGLPQSFLNRFTKVVVDPLDQNDLAIIASSRMPSSIPDGSAIVERMVAVNEAVQHDVRTGRAYGHKGGPWDFNLRDVGRWCQALGADPEAGPAVLADTIYVQRMRSEEDRQKLAGRFHEIFGEEVVVDPAPMVALTDTSVVCGRVVLRRVMGGAVREEDTQSSCRLVEEMAPSLHRTLEATARAVQLGWPCLLVGAGPDKGAVVKTLAGWVGASVRVLGLTPSTDVSELLGCFEQWEAERPSEAMERESGRAWQVCRVGLLAAASASSREQRDALLEKIARTADLCVRSGASNADDEQKTIAAYKELAKSVDDLVEALPSEEDRGLLSQGKGPPASSSKQGRFRWVDGPLVEALEQGLWLVMEHVNLCPPSVLDRLNPLLEPNGSLLLGEAGTGPDGLPRRIRPHPNFRLFLLMDPTAGELSRAMRNRCLELALLTPPLPGPITAEEPPAMAAGTTATVVDLARVCNRPELAVTMVHAHSQAGRRSRAEGAAEVTMEMLLSWGRLLAKMVARGWPVSKALHEAFVLVYGIRGEEAADYLPLPLEGPVMEPPQLGPCERMHATWNTTGAAVGRDLRCLAWLRDMMLRTQGSSSGDGAAAAEAVTHLLFGRLPENVAGCLPSDAYIYIQEKPLCPAPSLLPGLLIELERRFLVNGNLADLELRMQSLAQWEARHQDADGGVGLSGVLLRRVIESSPLVRQWQSVGASSSLDDPALWRLLTLSDAERSAWPLAPILRICVLDRLVQLAREMGASSHGAEGDMTGNHTWWAVAHAVVEDRWTGPPLSKEMQALLRLLSMVPDAVEEAVSELLLSTTPTTGAPVSPTCQQEAQQLLRLRDSLWACLAEVALVENGAQLAPFPWETFLVVWARLLKAMTRLFAGGSADSARGKQALHVVERAARATDSACGGLGDVKDRLWKRGGHPVVPYRSEAAEALRALRRLGQEAASTSSKSWDVGALCRKGHPLLALTDDVMVEVVEAMATLQWAATDEFPLTGGKSKKEAAADLEGLLGLPARLKAKVQEERQAFEGIMTGRVLDLARGAGDDDDDDDDGRAAMDESDAVLSSVVLVPPTVMARWTLVQLGRLTEAWLVAEESFVMAALSKACVAMASREEGKAQALAAVAEAVQRAKRLIPVALQNRCRTPVAIRPYQTLRWIWEAHFGGSNQAVEEDSLKALGQLLPVLLWTMWTDHYDHILESPRVLGWGLDTVTLPASEQEQLESMGGKSAKGAPPRSLLLFDLLGGAMGRGCGLRRQWWGTLASIEAVAARTQQLRAAVPLLATTRTGGDGPLEGLQASREACTSEWQRVLMAFARNDEDKTAISAAVLSGERLSETLGSLGDARLDALLEPVVIPSLGALHQEDRCGVGLGWVGLGLTCFHLLLPSRPLDPASRPVVKRGLLQSRLEAIKVDLSVQRWLARLESGIDLPPSAAPLVEEARQLDKSCQRLTRQAIVRPQSAAAFTQLRAELLEARASLLAVDRVMGLAQGAASASSKQHREQERAWRSAVTALSHGLARSYPFHQDFVGPVQAAVGHIHRGMSLLRSSRDRGAADEFARGAEFPLRSEGLTGLRRAARAVGGDAGVAVVLAELGRLEMMHHQGATRGLRCGHADVEKRLGEVVVAWGEAEERERERRAKENSLYKIKEKAVEDKGEASSSAAEEQDEEEQAAIRAYFPVEHEEQVGGLGEMSEDDMEMVAGIFSRLALLRQHADVDGALQLPPRTDECVRRAAFTMTYELAARLAGADVVGEDDAGGSLEGAHVMALSEAARRLRGVSSGVQVKEESKAKRKGGKQTEEEEEGADLSFMLTMGLPGATDQPDFYREPWVAEVVLLQRPLEALLERVGELLQDWAGHEGLIAIARSAATVRSLPVTTPVIKVLVGLETVLRLSQEWEQYAARHVSLSSVIKPLIDLVIRWRRLEFQSWPLLFDTQSRLAGRSAVRRFWPHMYRLTRQAMGALQHEVAAMSGQEQVSEGHLSALRPLFQAVDDLLRGSPLGEFAVRLSLVRVFALDCASWAASQGQEQAVSSLVPLARMLAVLHAYYAQFLPTVKSKLASIRRPLEKRLKDEAKLCKWDDQTYHALAESAARSHRRLVRVLRDYKMEMEAPVTRVLEEVMGMGSKAATEMDQPSTVVPTAKAVFTEVVAMQDHAEGELDEAKDDDDDDDDDDVAVPLSRSTLLMAKDHQLPPPVSLHDNPLASASLPCSPPMTNFDRLPRLAERMRKLLSESFFVKAGDGSGGLDAALVAEDISGSVFARMTALRGPGATKSAKQKAVLDLLRELRRQGLGSVPPAQRQEVQDPTALAIRPWPWMTEELKGETGRRTVAWLRGERYMFRGLAELQAMKGQLLKATHRDVPVTQARAMLMLVEGWLVIALQQRGRVHTLAQGAADLEHHMAWLDALAAEGVTEALPSQRAVTVAVAKQLEACKEAVSQIDQVQLAWQGVMQLLAEDRRGVMTRLASCAARLRAHVHRFTTRAAVGMWLASGQQTLSEGQTLASQLESELQALAEAMKDVSPPAMLTPTIREVQSIKATGIERRQDAVAPESGRTTESLAAFRVTVESAVEQCLLAVQGVVTGRRQKQADHNDGGDEAAEEGKEEEERTLAESEAHAQEEVKALRLDKVVAAFETLRQRLSEVSEGEEGEAVVTAMAKACTNLRALLGPLRACVELMCAEAVLSYKGLTKLGYVCVRVFRTLMTKGFCADKVEEEEGEEGEGSGEGGMSFEDDVEGTGMGSGEGKKDVSDQLESEEQILGLKGEEEEQEEDEKDGAGKKPPLEGEEKEQGMEMSGDFDGEMRDVEKEDDRQQEEGDEERDKEEELEREMGEADENDVVDEKLWGEEDEEEKEQEGKEKTERGSKVKGRGQDGDEVMTKEDGPSQEEEEEEEDKKGEEDEEAGKKEKKEKVPEGQEEEEETEEGGGRGEEEGDIEEENYEEKALGVDVRPPDETELPEDMQLDEGDEDDGEGDEGQQQEGQEEEEAAMEGGDEKEDDDGKRGDEDGQKEEEDALEETSPMDTDEPGEEKEGGEEEEEAAGADPTAKGEAEPNEDQQEDERVSSKPSDQTREQQGRAFGLQDSKGNESLASAADEAMRGEKSERQQAEVYANTEEEEEDQGGKEEKKKEEEDGEGEEGDRGAGGGKDGAGPSSWRYTGEENPRQQPQEGSEERRKRREAPNPFREAGSAMRHWKRTLDVMEKEDREGQAHDDEDKATDREEGSGEEQQEGEEKGGGKFEYVLRGEGGDTTQVLGPVMTEEEAAVMPTKEEEEKEGDDAMDVAEEGEEGRGGVGDGEEEDEADTGQTGRRKKEENAVLLGPSRPKDPRQSGEEKPLGEEAQSKEAQAAKDKKRRSGQEEEEEDDMDENEGADDRMEVDEKAETNQDVGAADEDLLQRGALVATNQAALQGKDDLHDRMDEEEEEEQQELCEGLGALWEAAGPMDSQAAIELWDKYRSASRPIAQRLCEQLRLVLEPMVATKLQGDYRTGKRINMRRVISYIASGFRRDKIWLRRTKPAKRAYQVLLAIDDSMSMRHFKAEDVALMALATLATGMTTLEIGQLGVASFGTQVRMLHDFSEPFTEEAGARVISSFTFQQPSTDGAAMLSNVISALDEARSTASVGGGSSDKVLQLVFVVSDGSFERGSKTQLRRLVREMADKGQLLVLLLVDNSILDRQEVEYSAAGVRINRYLDSYPFPYYIVLQRVNVLPEVLADALRQYFELVQRTASAGQH